MDLHNPKLGLPKHSQVEELCEFCQGTGMRKNPSQAWDEKLPPCELCNGDGVPTAYQRLKRRARRV